MDPGGHMTTMEVGLGPWPLGVCGEGLLAGALGSHLRQGQLSQATGQVSSWGVGTEGSPRPGRQAGPPGCCAEGQEPAAQTPPRGAPPSEWDRPLTALVPDQLDKWCPEMRRASGKKGREWAVGSG